jgi:hypothetical protein
VQEELHGRLRERRGRHGAARRRLANSARWL